jgi:hypothetical protein
MKYLAGLASAFRKRGSRLFVNSNVNVFRGGPPARAETRHGPSVRCPTSCRRPLPSSFALTASSPAPTTIRRCHLPTTRYFSSALR